jgi:DNA repair protein endonuclease SAE2/CtIP C-terminus
MPPRQKPPLWRSPTTSQEASHRCRKHGGHGTNGNDEVDQDKEDEIAAHRQAISRHRHQWERPTTPPAYWKIGFPDTQEVADINERAEEMHEKKQRIMEREAAKPDGKYRKK